MFENVKKFKDTLNVFKKDFINQLILNYEQDKAV